MYCSLLLHRCKIKTYTLKWNTGFCVIYSTFATYWFADFFVCFCCFSTSLLITHVKEGHVFESNLKIFQANGWTDLYVRWIKLSIKTPRMFWNILTSIHWKLIEQNEANQFGKSFVTIFWAYGSNHFIFDGSNYLVRSRKFYEKNVFSYFKYFQF